MLDLLHFLKRSAQVQYSYNTTALQNFFLVLQLYCTCADRLRHEPVFRRVHQVATAVESHWRRCHDGVISTACDPTPSAAKRLFSTADL